MIMSNQCFLMSLYQTRNGVDWKYFPMSTTEGIIRIKGEYFPRDFLYGVSALTETGGGGIEWQDCVYLRHAGKIN
jgi:hypothetical protein